MPWVSGLLPPSFFLFSLSDDKKLDSIDENVQKFKKKCRTKKKVVIYFFNNYYTIVLPYTAACVYSGLVPFTPRLKELLILFFII